MFEGSLTISTSMPLASMAFLVLARRSAYSARVNFRFGWLMIIFLCSAAMRGGVLQSAFKCGAGAGRLGAVTGESGNGGVLHAGAREIGNGDIHRRLAA